MYARRKFILPSSLRSLAGAASYHSAPPLLILLLYDHCPESAPCRYLQHLYCSSPTGQTIPLRRRYTMQVKILSSSENPFVVPFVDSRPGTLLTMHRRLQANAPTILRFSNILLGRGEMSNPIGCVPWCRPAQGKTRRSLLCDL